MLVWRLWISVGILVFCTVAFPVHAAQPEDNLLESALTGNLDGVSSALSNGADIDAANQRGSTALMLAASNNHLPVVKLLLSRGAAVNATTSTGATALIVAAYKGNREILKELLRYGANVEAQTRSGATAATAASEAGHKEVAPILSENASPGVSSTDLQFLQASRQGNAGKVKTLLEKGANVNARDSDGYTALYRACDQGSFRVAELLLDRSADVNAINLSCVPEVASADAQVFWSHGCFTNVLDLGARHLTLRQLDMPANFFAGNNCVAESGQLPSNFLLGVSTPGSDVRFRRQMRSRLGVPMTVAGNPPVRFGSADGEVGDGTGTGTGTGDLPSFRHFLGRVALNDLVGIGLLPIAEALAFAVFYTLLLPSFGHPVVSALAALILGECSLIGAAVLVKKLLVGSRWGADHSTSFWSWRHFTYFFAQDCFFVWCRRSMGILAGTVLSNVILRRMGCRIGRRTLLPGPLQACDWNAVSFGDDCVVAGLLQLHTFENMTLRVKRTEVRSGSALNFGSTVMGGAVLGPGTTLLPLSLVLKEMSLPTATYQGSPAEPVDGGLRSRCPRCRSRAPSPLAPLAPLAPIAPRTLEAPQQKSGENVS